MEISSVKHSVNAVTSRVDTMLPLLQQLVSQNNVTSGGQQRETRENATSGGQENSHSDIHDNDVDDRISLQPNREESQGMFQYSDNDSELSSSASKQDRRFNRLIMILNCHRPLVNRTDVSIDFQGILHQTEIPKKMRVIFYVTFLVMTPKLNLINQMKV